MRWVALFLCLAAWVPAAGAVAAGPAPCMSSGDTAEAVAARKVVSPREALVLARKAVPDAEVLRANLCGEPDALVYRITVLRPDGRLVRVTVDAPSGKVRTVR